jgi:hypothetical protein
MPKFWIERLADGDEPSEAKPVDGAYWNGDGWRVDMDWSDLPKLFDRSDRSLMIFRRGDGFAIWIVG